jgi:hypothetical protein
MLMKEEENTEYILINCKKYTKKREETKEKIIRIIVEVDKVNNKKENIEKTIPLWCMIEDKTTSNIKIYLELESFDKLARSLEYILKELKKIIEWHSDTQE